MWGFHPAAAQQPQPLVSPLPFAWELGVRALDPPLTDDYRNRGKTQKIDKQPKEFRERRETKRRKRLKTEKTGKQWGKTGGKENKQQSPQHKQAPTKERGRVRDEKRQIDRHQAKIDLQHWGRQGLGNRIAITPHGLSATLHFL